MSTRLRWPWKPRRQRRVKVRVLRVVDGCWEVWCRRCADRQLGVVALVGTWERAMLRAERHVAEAHG